jgi:hypothetical protein
MGWLYTRLVASNSFAPEYRAEDSRETYEAISEEVPFVATPPETRLNNSIEEFIAMFGPRIVHCGTVC